MTPELREFSELNSTYTSGLIIVLELQSLSTWVQSKSRPGLANMRPVAHWAILYFY